MILLYPTWLCRCARRTGVGNEKHARAGWIGAFVLATEIKPWGIQGFVHAIKTHDERASVWIRLQWDHIDYVGRAALVPADLEEGFLEEGSV
jgi:hypothetical protein